ncbi:MAG: YtxH domain-containing protein [Candidatus Pacebacteria bacterium]|nr:YtxH domain-containing protein [Candidatus Paceibacterota bacterium]
MSEQNQGSFIGGLALGMFAGAAGYFLFATKDGSKVRKEIEKEWQEAKEVLAEEGVIKDKDVKLSDLVSDWLDIERTKPPTKKKTIKKNTAKSKTSKFKGV